MAHRERALSLPVAPFVAWIQERLPFYEGLGDFARACGVDERQLRGYLRGERRRIHVRTADRMLMHEGSTSLDEVFGL